MKANSVWRYEFGVRYDRAKREVKTSLLSKIRTKEVLRAMARAIERRRGVPDERVAAVVKEVLHGPTNLRFPSPQEIYTLALKERHETGVT
jgi:hypothetical protein